MTPSEIGPAPTADSFEAVAGDYDAITPPYPDAAMKWLLPPGANSALDLGAGTGQLSRLLVARGVHTIAVDPSPAMLRELSRAVPAAETHQGTAEDIPLPDGSVDAVVVGHAWHWVDLPRAVPEVARVLRPGGQLGLVWNVRDERVDWVAEIDRIVHRGTAYFLNSENPEVGEPFGPIERLDVEWSLTHTPASLLEQVRRRLSGISADAGQRDEIYAEAEQFVRTHPALAGKDRFELPYIARCSRTQRP
ncbi:methyltransferase domain-containing protein [Nocardia africana]